jgi:hypothetical protein
MVRYYNKDFYNFDKGAKSINIYLHKICENPNIKLKYLNTIFYLNIISTNAYKKIRKNPQRICLYML